MNLMFSALFFHIRSHFCICHNFQPFLQKTESFLFADIISALYNPLEECEARFVHRKGWAEWGEGKAYGQKSCNSCLFPRFSFTRHLVFMGSLSFFPSLTMSELEKISNEKFPLGPSGPNPTSKATENIQDLLEHSLKLVGSPGLWKHSALGSIWFQYQQIQRSPQYLRIVCLKPCYSYLHV